MGAKNKITGLTVSAIKVYDLSFARRNQIFRDTIAISSLALVSVLGLRTTAEGAVGAAANVQAAAAKAPAPIPAPVVRTTPINNQNLGAGQNTGAGGSAGAASAKVTPNNNIIGNPQPTVLPGSQASSPAPIQNKASTPVVNAPITSGTSILAPVVTSGGSSSSSTSQNTPQPQAASTPAKVAPNNNIIGNPQPTILPGSRASSSGSTQSNASTPVVNAPIMTSTPAPTTTTNGRSSSGGGSSGSTSSNQSAGTQAPASAAPATTYNINGQQMTPAQALLYSQTKGLSQANIAANPGIIAALGNLNVPSTVSSPASFKSKSSNSPVSPATTITTLSFSAPGMQSTANLAASSSQSNQTEATNIGKKVGVFNNVVGQAGQVTGTVGDTLGDDVLSQVGGVLNKINAGISAAGGDVSGVLGVAQDDGSKLIPAAALGTSADFGTISLGASIIIDGLIQAGIIRPVVNVPVIEAPKSSVTNNNGGTSSPITTTLLEIH